MAILPERSIDRRLLRAAARRATAEEMSEAVLGQLTPAECLDRVKTILDSKNIWDEIEERRLLLIDIAEWLDWLKDQRDNTKSWQAINRALKLMSDQIERSNINVNDVSTKLAAAHAGYFTEGYLAGFNKVLDLLREREIIEAEIEDDEMFELVKAGVDESQEYLKKVTVREADGGE